MPFYKNIWFWIDLFLIILCAAFYLLAIQFCGNLASPEPRI